MVFWGGGFHASFGGEGGSALHCTTLRKFYSDFNTVFLLCLSCCLLLV